MPMTLDILTIVLSILQSSMPAVCGNSQEGVRITQPQTLPACLEPRGRVGVALLQNLDDHITGQGNILVGMLWCR